MNKEIIIPSPGESITQVQLARWLVQNGDMVERDQEIVEIDSDKASFPIVAPVKGSIKIMAREGETIAVGTVIATIETNHPDPFTNSSTHPLTSSPTRPLTPSPSDFHASPLAKNILEEQKIDLGEITQTFPGKKITRKDIESYLNIKRKKTESETSRLERKEDRKKLSTLRLKLAERLVSVKNQTAMLTTFNEINMTEMIRIKEKFGEEFREHFGVGIGFMSFFAKASVLSLKEFPQVNSMIDGEEQITPGYVDLGIAVSAPKGLVVPVIRNAESLGIAELEKIIKALAVKARDNKITLDEMKGGSFTITNGGVFGSLLSTPILNPPQSAILGMHKIQERPIAIDGKVIIAPMMYVALSYDHRIIDGKESVGFLLKVKELIEDPVRMLTEGMDPVKLLLDL